MSVITDIYTHYIEGTQVYPSGEWEIVHRFPEGCIFSRREFSGTLTFGNIRHNGISDDYDYLMGFGEQYCQRLNYEIYCNDELYWEGYINHTIGYEIDEDNCTIKTTPLLSDEYDCFVIYGDIEYEFTNFNPFINTVVYDDDGAPPYPIEAEFNTYRLTEIMSDMITQAAFLDADDVCGFAGNIKSSFFWNDDYPDATAVTSNYITGVDYWDDILLQRLSYVRNQLGGTATLVLQQITFNKLMGWLRDMFNVYWYIDSNGDFRMEHLHYFEHDFADRDHTELPDDIDLITIENDYNDKSICLYKNKWKNIESELPSVEIFEMLDADTDDFVGLPIYYDEECTYNYPTIQRKEYIQSEIFTDLPMIIADADSVAGDGFMFFAAKYEDIFKDTDDLNDWPNNDFDILFANVGAAIGTANDGGGGCFAKSNNFGACVAGQVYNIYIEGYNNIAGQDPSIQIVDAANNLRSNIVVVNASGIYSLTITAGAGFNGYLYITHTLACDWLWTDCVIDLVENEWVVQYDTGAISALNRNNGHLSVANLMDNYWRHGRVLDEGIMNGNPEIFDSIRPNRLQVKIIIPKCCERIHWNTYYDTYLGKGKIYKALEKKYTHEIELLYE